MRQSQAMSYLSQTEIATTVEEVSRDMCREELNKLYEVLCSAKSVCIICGSNFGRYTAAASPRTAYGTCNVCKRGSVSVMHVDAFNGLRTGSIIWRSSCFLGWLCIRGPEGASLGE